LFPARPTVFVVIMPFGVTVGRVGLDRLSRLFESPAKALDRRALLLVHEGAVVLLVSERVDLDLLVRGLNRRAPVALSVGSSRPVTDVRGFAGAFRQAQRATTIGRRIGTANRVNRYHDLGVYRERRAFVQETLGTVAGTDQEAVESRRVLRSFRRTNGNVAESARQLFLHHNTFRQRLAKLQSVLGDFLGDADLRLAVFVALDLHRLDNDLEG
jgi:sugar diacid utilization regulator